MARPTPPPSDELSLRAAEWLSRLCAEDCSSDERAAFDAWIAASRAHRAAFERYERLWAMPKDLSTHSEMFARLDAVAQAAGPVGSVEGDRKSRRFSTRAGWTHALASGITCIALAGIWFTTRDAPEATRIATAAHELRTVTLPDGSVVTLNARTELRTAFSQGERRVQMSGGEAFFDVMKEPARPFVVRVGNSEVRVLGTQFNVRQSDGELEVVVREGRVDVVPDFTVAATASVPRVELTPGNRARIRTAANQVLVAQIDPERVTAWRTGMIRFEDAPLPDVLEDVNRYTDKPLVIANDALRSLKISGRFRVGDADAVRFLLRERFDVQSDVERDQITLR